MNISSTSSTTDTGSSTATLQKKLADLEKQLTTENASKDDAKTKETKAAAIEVEIELVQDEITQAEKSSSTGTSQIIDTKA
jgi:hypothetical protein